tara:strand:- start:433 stop:624 length:192 start_codon:yes stop_codon:yes gene_type:complete
MHCIANRTTGLPAEDSSFTWQLMMASRAKSGQHKHPMTGLMGHKYPITLPKAVFDGRVQVRVT